MRIFYISDLRVVFGLAIIGVLFSLGGWRELRRRRRTKNTRGGLALLVLGLVVLALPAYNVAERVRSFYAANRVPILLWALTGVVTLVAGLAGVWMFRDLRQRRAWQRAVRVMSAGRAGGAAEVAGAPVPVRQYLQGLSPTDLETFSARMFQQLGYRAELHGGSGDHGVDVRLTNPSGELEVVQCKQYRSPVGEPEIRAFYGTLVHTQAVRGYFVAPGGFTRQARRWAAGKPIVLADAAVLEGMISQAGR